MNRNIGIYALILCFILSNTQLGFASEVVDVSPVVVQPYDAQALNQQVLDIDRKNRDNEVAIKDLVDQNDQLAKASLAKQQDPALASLNQTMDNYRDALNERDRERILANSEIPGGRRYGDLVRLTEDANDMTVHQDLLDKSGMLTEKYQLLSTLKDEMTTLNDKLNSQQDSTVTQQQSVIDGFKKLAQEQQEKIQMLVARLNVMDKKISQLDDQLIQKEEEIAQLRDRLNRVQMESSDKDETIRVQNNKIALLEARAQSKESVPASVTSPIAALAPIIVNPPATNVAVPAITVNLPTNQQENVNLLTELVQKDKIIKTQQDQITLLNGQLNKSSSTPVEVASIPPITVNPAPSSSSNAARLAAMLVVKDKLIKAQQDRIAQLYEQLKNVASSPTKVAILPAISVNPSSNPQMQAQLLAKDKMIADQQQQIETLRDQAKQLLIKENLIQSQADQLNAASVQYKNQDTLFASIQTKIADLKDKVQIQVADLKAKDESIHWLNQALMVTKDKAKYYQLASQVELGRLEDIQHQVKRIQGDFAQRFKDYDQFENAIIALKEHLSGMNEQLSQKQDEINRLKSQLAYQNAQHENQVQKQAQTDDRLSLAKQLIGLQEQEAYLLGEKDDLEQAQNKLFDQHADAYENRIKQLLVQHKFQDANFLNRLQELQAQLAQKELQARIMQGELTDKIAQEKNQTVLLEQIQDLSNKIQDQDAHVADLESRIKLSEQENSQVDSLKQQLATAQDSIQQLKTQLDAKVNESNQMTEMMSDYQQKLEAKDNAYNKQYGQLLSFKKYEALMTQKIADLNNRLQLKEAEIVTIKKDMVDLQASTEAKNMDLQAKDLGLAMVQQRQSDDKIKQYQDKINSLQAVNDQQAQEITGLKSNLNESEAKLKNIPSSDEVIFLKTGLKKATDELKANQDALNQVKQDSLQYASEYIKEQGLVSHMKKQLQALQLKLQDKSEDLTYNNMALLRLKERSTASMKGLKSQVADLTRQLKIAQKKFMVKPHGNNSQELQMELKQAQLQIKNLRAQVNDLQSLSNTNETVAKLTQALNKINEQGRIIHILAQKLEDAGQKVDLTHLEDDDE